ncbi:XK-related protein 6-like [Oppia nitens]|uniref:XK-related protein 6-like n=1 Tax=Oppia nitens TaxID=1686743 RepID=UPI0023DC5868|nr:XK-related protein 6-like [Oppia nitens]
MDHMDDIELTEMVDTDNNSISNNNNNDGIVDNSSIEIPTTTTTVLRTYSSTNVNDNQLTNISDNDNYDYGFTLIDAIKILISGFAYIFDVGKDLGLAIHFYLANDYGYFWLTLLFVIIPSLIITVISVRMSISDMFTLSDGGINIVYPQKTCRQLFSILQLGPIVCYLDAFLYCLDSWKLRRFRHQSTNYSDRIKNNYYLKILAEKSANSLRFYECLLESIPQLILQLYILIQTFDNWFYDNRQSDIILEFK